MMGRKYSSEYMIQYIKNEGYVFLDDNTYLTNCVQRIVVKDSSGYLYDTTFNCIKMNAERNQRAKFVYIYNKFSFQNIVMWAINNRKSYCVVGGDYSKQCNKTIILSCNICGKKWKNSWSYLLAGAGCIYCSRKAFSIECSLGYMYPLLVLEWDFIENKESPFSYLPNSSKNVFWKCPICNRSWKAIIQGRTRLGNPCSHVERNRKERKVPESIMSELSQTRNARDLLDDFPHTTKKYWWKCSFCGHEWNCRLGDRISKESGCPKCSSSKGEKRVSGFLSNANMRFAEQKTFDDCRNKRKLPFDFYLIDHNTIIEYDGEFHFDLPKFRFKNIEIFKDGIAQTQKHDTIKTKYCEDSGIKLIRIPYWEYDNIENILEENLPRGGKV